MSESSGFEIVEVIGDCRLLDGSQREHVYWRRDGRPLAAGHYVVVWPPQPVQRRFNEDVVFKGPFQQLAEAQAALERLYEQAEAQRTGWGQPRNRSAPATLAR